MLLGPGQIVLLGAALALPSPGATPPAARARYLMGTVCEGTAYGGGAASALDAAFEEIARLEAVLSDYRPDSELSRLNREAASAPFACSPDLFRFIETAVRYSQNTGGAFDITVGPLVRAWGLRGGGRLATPGEVQEALRNVGASRLLLDRGARTVRFAAEGMGLDPGALGKGYALDAAAKVLRARGVASALLDFGGQVLAVGSPSGSDGWEVDVAHPARRHESAFTLRLRDASVSTSGSSERRIVVGARTLGHIVDPRSGQPAGGEGSVSVIATTAAEADAASTAMLVMGPEQGLAWAEGRQGLSAAYLEAGGPGRLRVLSTRNFQGNDPGRASRAGAHKAGGSR